MPSFSPEQLATWTGGRWNVRPAAALTGFEIDTRLLQPGQVFVALSTDKRDGHAFVAVAQERAASAALVAREMPGLSIPQLIVPDPLLAFQRIAREHRRSFSGRVVGISGSCGKTSTKDLLALLLGGKAQGVLATEGNLNNHLGVPLTLTRIEPERDRVAIVEAGISAPGEMAVLSDLIEPDLTLITLVGPAHLQELGGLQGVAREKARLSASTKAAGLALFPGQCAEFPAFCELGVKRMILEPAEVLRPAQPPKDVVYFTTTQREGRSVVAIAYGLPPPLVFRMRPVSRGMAQNAALAICAALWLGVSSTEIQARLEAWKPARLRGETFLDQGRLLYVDCYNANPASMLDALEIFLATAPAGKPRLFVLGCMEELGWESSRYHRELGRTLALGFEDRALVVGSEARSLVEGLLEAGARHDQVEAHESAAQMRESVAAWRGSVFVKGSRRYQLETVLGGIAAVAQGAAH